MTLHRWTITAALFAGVLAFVQPGSAQNPEALLSGEYVMTLHMGYGERSEAGFGVAYVSMVFDGANSGTIEIIHSSLGNTLLAPFTYSVLNDGTFSLRVSSESNESTLHGIVSADGKRFAMWPLSVGMKKSSGMSDGILDGEYITAGYVTNEADTSGGQYIRLRCAGDGSGTFAVLSCSHGDTGTYPCVYGVNEDGTFLLTVSGEAQQELSFQGIVSSDGECFTMVNCDSAAFGIYAGIRKSSGMSSASLIGDYVAIQYLTEENSSTEYIDVNFTGNGSATFEIMHSSGRDSGDTGTFAYSVNNDGTLTFAVGEQGGQLMPGILSADGTTLMTVYPGNPECGIMAALAKSDFASAVSGQSLVLPGEYKLRQNYPNPFNPSTTISYDIPAAGMVHLSVFNSIGQEIAILAKGPHQPGRYQAIWDARVQPSGVYFYRLQAGSFMQTNKMLLIK